MRSVPIPVLLLLVAVFLPGELRAQAAPAAPADVPEALPATAPAAAPVALSGAVPEARSGGDVVAAGRAVPGPVVLGIVAPAAVAEGLPLVASPAPVMPLVPLSPAAPLQLEPVQAQLRTDGAGEAAALVRQPDQRNWWWLVGAMVTAGVILAVIL